MITPLGDDAPAVLVFLGIFLIKFALISISAYQDVRHPFRGAAHDVAKFIHRYIGTAFDDHFVVDMSDNPAEGQIFHGIAEKVAGYCLDNVLHKFRCNVTNFV